MKIIHQGSGSRGNGVMYESDSQDFIVQVDAGLKPEKASDYLLITHKHGDHASKIKKHLLMTGTLVCPEDVFQDLMNTYGKKDYDVGVMLQEKWMEPPINGDGFSIKAVPMLHDVACYSYIIENDGQKAVHITDTVDVPLFDLLIGADIYVIESNYSTDMMPFSSRPEYIAERTVSIGHLSNEMAIKVLAELATEKTKEILFIHLSTDSNHTMVASSKHTELIIKNHPELAHIPRYYPKQKERLEIPIPNTKEMEHGSAEQAQKEEGQN